MGKQKSTVQAAPSPSQDVPPHVTVLKMKMRNGRYDRPRDVLNARQAAPLLKLTPGALNHRGTRGEIEIIKIGRMSFYSADVVRRHILSENTRTKAEPLIAALEEIVAANNADIEARESARGRRNSG